MGIQPNLIAALVRSDKERQMTEPQILAGSGSFPDKWLTFHSAPISRANAIDTCVGSGLAAVDGLFWVYSGRDIRGINPSLTI
jgi:hypothetical protein